MFSHMGQIWCQFFCDFMKISRFENVLFVCLNFCVSLRITCKGVENESFQEFSIISQKLKACSTCSKNPPDGPPPYPGSKWTVYVAFFIFHIMGQIWCQFFCDFMKISRFENVLFVCLNFCVSLRITCKGVENESFQEFSIISQKLKACSTCSKNPPDGPPPYPGSKWTVYVAFFIFHMREHKERGGQPAPKCRVFSNFYVIFSNILPLLFCCVFAFFFDFEANF